MILDRLLPSPKAGQPPPHDDFWYNPISSDVSKDVNPTTATQVATVFACVRVLSETLAQLPLHLMRGREKAKDHPLYNVLHTQSNVRNTAFEFREMMQGHLCLRGNAFALKRYNSAGQVEALIPLHPDRMQVFLLSIVENSKPSEGKLGFIYTDQVNNIYKLTQDEIFRVQGISFDGILGVSPITECKKAVELSAQAENHGLRWWKNAAKPGGVIQFPKDEWLDDEEAHRRIKASWRAAHTGDDLYTVAILEGGAEWKPMGISNEDSEWLESRRYQTTEIARMFRVPPHMIASAIEHGNTYANVEQSDLDFIKHTMLPWFVRWEQAILRDLVDDDELSVKFSLEGFLRADSRARAEFYEKLRWLGVFNANEIRELEDLDPFDGGDVRHIPVNMIPMDMSGQQVINQQQRIEEQRPRRKEEQKEENTDETVESRWIDDIARRISSAETRGIDSVTKDSWIKRHRDYVWKAIFPLVRDGSTSLAEEIIQGVRADVKPELRYDEIIALLKKGSNNGQ